MHGLTCTLLITDPRDLHSVTITDCTLLITDPHDLHSVTITDCTLLITDPHDLHTVTTTDLHCDATMTFLNVITNHMDTTGSYVRVHFLDFASAFSSVQPRVLLQRHLDLNVNQSIIFRLREFLSGRTQRVSLDGFVSEEFVLQTGVPLGCSSCFVFVCLLLLLFLFVLSLYEDETSVVRSQSKLLSST